MQVVIDLPNEDYQVTLTKIMLACHGCKITELPKGHGDLIDRSMIAFDYWSVDGYVCVEKKDIFKMPVIVPADKMETEQMLNTPMEIQNEIRDARMLELIKAQGVTENENNH